ncbi:MAG: hypothetical protein RL693_602 [Verrucomicrobiota bacterium]|jgi:hypothetical protein
MAMVGEEMHHPWSLQVSLRLGEHAWSDLDVWLEDKHYEYCLTHTFSSPLTEIANGLRALSQDEESVSFTLHEEPGSHVWSLKQIVDAKHLLAVTISSYGENIIGGEPALESAFEILTFKVARDFFIETFTIELNKIAAQLRYARFAKNRDASSFPWAICLELNKNLVKRAE